MKTAAFAITAAALLASCATQMPSNAKDYSCTDYNAAKNRLDAKPKGTTLNDLYKDAELLKFMKVNLVGFKSAVGKHPNREEAMRTIDDSADVQALQCRVAPKAIVKYTAEQVTPASVRLGYVVDFSPAGGMPAAAKEALGNRRLGKAVADEPGMEMVKKFIQNCASGSAPAAVCKLGNL